MQKWKDTARTTMEIKRKYKSGIKTVFPKDSLIIIEKEVSEGLLLVMDINQKKSDRRYYKMVASEISIEDYSLTKDNIQMLIADGWDAQDLLRRKK